MIDRYGDNGQGATARHNISRPTRTLGKKEPQGMRIETKISYEELSEKVGTTPARISMFMERIRKHGLLETSGEHCLVINERKFTDYLAVRAAREVCAVRDTCFQDRPILDGDLSRIKIEFIQK
jgi:hypothetical protein